MSDISFRVMTAIFSFFDFFYNNIDRRVETFGIKPGMTVVDYGCGPGRYMRTFSEFVGENGRVYAVDIHELAMQAVGRKIQKHKLSNVIPVHAKGYDAGIPDQAADIICAMDMFFSISDPPAFLAELKRILKVNGILIIDDGHQSRESTKNKLWASGHWRIWEETRDHLKCKLINHADYVT